MCERCRVNTQTNELVAIKVLSLDTSEDDVADIRREIALLAQLKQADAQNVTRYHGSVMCGDKLWIIMDYCQGGSIRTLMKSGRVEERYCAVIMREVLLALAYIHKFGIIHRDVKAANILVANDGRVQLCDFGVATQLAANHLKRTTFVGTPYWMAPEVITEGSQYNYKADIWSLGITLYEIATGNPPFADQEPMRAIIMIPRSQPAKLEGNAYSSAMKEFIGHCLRESPDDRPSAEELAKTKYVKSVSKFSTSCLRDLIVRFEKWQEVGGVRQSLVMHARRCSDLSDLQVDALDEEEPVGWDFDTVRSRLPPNESEEQLKISPIDSAASAPDQFATSDNQELIIVPPDAVLATTVRPAAAARHSQANGLLNTGSSLLNPLPSSRQEHPLKQLFEDPTKTPTARTRKDNAAPAVSYPSPYNAIPRQHSSNASSSTATSELDNNRTENIGLPEINTGRPFQMNISSANPQQTLVRQPLSTSHTRPIRSYSVDQQAMSRSCQTSEYLQQQADLYNLPPTTIIGTRKDNGNAPTVPSPQSSPPKLPFASMSISSNSSNPRQSPPKIESPVRSELGIKTRSKETSRYPNPNLTLNLKGSTQTAILGSDYLPPSPSRIPHSLIMSSTQSSSTDTLEVETYSLPTMLPLKLEVLSEPAVSTSSGGIVAGKALTDEIERIFRGFGKWLDMVGKGLGELSNEKHGLGLPKDYIKRST